MLDITIPDANKRINCTAPIEIDNLKKYFTDKSLYFDIDYNNSTLHGKKLLVYLSNLDVPSNLVFSTNLNFENKSALLHDYMTLPSVIKLPIFNLATSSIIFKAKGYDLKNAYPNPYFSIEETETYIEQHEKLVKRWIIFLDSCLIYAQKCIPELNDEKFLTEGLEIITDREYIGQSVVNLFSLDFFFHNYYAKPLKTLAYFKPQFEEYMFQGKNLFHYFHNKYNLLLPTIASLGKDYSHVN